MRNYTLQVKCNNQCAALMSGSALNRVVISFNFDPYHGAEGLVCGNLPGGSTTCSIGAHTYAYLTIHILHGSSLKLKLHWFNLLWICCMVAKSAIYKCLADVSDLFAVYTVYS